MFGKLIQYAIIDKFRFRFLGARMREDVGLFKKYGWFYKVNKYVFVI
jgi:hypothetical protein